jgi:glucokinase
VRGFLEQLRPYVVDLTAQAGLSGIPACGIGVPGVVHYSSGTLEFSGPFGWRRVPFADLAEEILGCTATLDTDVNAGALADLWYGAARDSADTLYISWGTGIGAAIAIGRRIYHSRGGAMCNLGHMPAKPDSSRLCYCGTYGCLEVEAGGKAIVETAMQRYNVLNNEDLSPATLAEAAAQGDAIARAILEEAAVLLARVLGGVLALLNPDTVVLGGGVSGAFPIVRGAFDNELRLRTPVFSLPLTEIKHSRFSDSAGVVGAAVLGRLGKQ